MPTMLKAAFKSGSAALKLYFDHEQPDAEVEDLYHARPLPFIIGTEQFIDSMDGGLTAGEEGHGGYDDYADEGKGEEEEGEWAGEEDGSASGGTSAPSRPKPPKPQHHDEDDGEKGDWGAEDDVDESASGRGRGEGERNRVPVSQHPTYEPYFKMLKVGLPPPFVKNKMESEGVDSSFLDMDPNALVAADGSASSDEGASAQAATSVPLRLPARTALPIPKKRAESQDSADDWGKSSAGEGDSDEDSAPVPAKAQRPPTIRVPPPPRKGGAAPPQHASLDEDDEEEDSDEGEWGNITEDLKGRNTITAKGRTTMGDGDAQENRHTGVRVSGNIKEQLAAQLAAGQRPGDKMLKAHSQPVHKDSGDDDWGDDDGSNSTISDTGPSKDSAGKNAGSTSKGKPSFEDDDEEDEDRDLFGGGGVEDPYDLFGGASTMRRAGASGVSRKTTADLTKDSFSDLFGGGQTRERSNSGESVDSLFGGGGGGNRDSGRSGAPKSRQSFSALFGDANDDNLFDDVTEAPVSSSSKGGGGGGNFSDDEDEDIFGGSKEKSSPKAAPAATASSTATGNFKGVGASDLFGGGGLFEKPSYEKPNATTAAIVPTSVGKITKGASLFDDDDDDDDDLFGSKSKAKTAFSSTKAADAPKPKAGSKPAAASLFDDDDDDDADLFTSKPKAKPVAAKAAVEAAVGKAPVTSSRLISLFDDAGDDDEGDLFGAGLAKQAEAQAKSKAAKAEEERQTAINAELARAASAAQAETEFKRRAAIDAEIEKAAAAAKVEAARQDVIAESAAAEASKAASVPVPVPATASKSNSYIGGVKLAVPPRPVSDSDSDVDSSDSDAGFSAPTQQAHTPASKPASASKSMFGDDEEEEDNAFGKKPVPAKADAAPSRQAVMFGDDEDDDDDVFGFEPKAKAASVTAAEVAPTLAPALIASPPVASPSGSMSKRTSSGLASRMAGMDASKLGLGFGGPPPKKSPSFASQDSTNVGDDDDSQGKNESSGSLKTGSEAALERATMAPKPGRGRPKATRNFASEDSLVSIGDASFTPTDTSTNMFGDVGAEDDQTWMSASSAVNSALTSATTSPRRDTNMFGDADDGDLFGKATPAVTAPVSVPASAPAPAQAAVEPILSTAAKKASAFLDADDADDDLFSSMTSNRLSTKAGTAKPVPKLSSMFGDDDSDDDLFGSKAGSTKPSVRQTSGAAAKSKSSIFGDDADDDDDDPLFGGSSKTMTKKPSTVNSSLFD